MRRTKRDGHDAINADGTGRVKFRYADGDRYMDIEMEGGNDALAEGLRSLAHALSRGSGVTSPSTRVLPASRPTTPGTTSEPEEPDPQQEIQFPPDGEDGKLGESAVSEVQPNGDAPDRPRQRRTPRTPSILNDIDLNSGTVSLKDFAAQKKPQELSDRFIVVAAWYKQYQSHAEINADRIYTAFKFLEWPSPDDVPQTLRNLKSRNKWFDKGAGTGAYKINIIGLNVVDKLGAISQE